MRPILQQEDAAGLQNSLRLLGKALYLASVIKGRRYSGKRTRITSKYASSDCNSSHSSSGGRGLILSRIRRPCFWNYLAVYNNECMPGLAESGNMLSASPGMHS